jgi:hypothetical protein
MGMSILGALSDVELLKPKHLAWGTANRRSEGSNLDRSSILQNRILVTSMMVGESSGLTRLEVVPDDAAGDAGTLQWGARPTRWTLQVVAKWSGTLERSEMLQCRFSDRDTNGRRRQPPTTSSQRPADS